MFGKYLSSEMLARQFGGKKPDVSRRAAEDMRPVLFDPSPTLTDGKRVFYTVLRNLEVISKKARYDITIIPEGNVGGEFNKTFGHYHKGPQPELYEILSGKAYFLLQKADNDPADILEAYMVEASAGEKAVMPPGFGHLSINIGSEELALGNWIGFVDYDYETIKQYRGGCYYVLKKDKNIAFEKNPSYKSVPELKKLKLRDVPELGIKNDKDHSVLDLRNSPEKLDWLSNPEKYKELLTIKKLYKEV